MQKKTKKHSYLKSPDLLPIHHEKKSIGVIGFFAMWVGMAILLATFDIGAAGIQEIPLTWVVLATLVGCIAIGGFISLIGDIGVEHGLAFPVYMRAPFGIIGTHIPSLTRAITASFWFGINTYFGATAINAIMNTMVAGFDNWLLCYIIFALFQLINTASGIKWIERFADISAPLIVIFSLIIYQNLTGEINAQGENVWAWVSSPVTGGAAVTAFMVVIFANMGYWATLGCDIPTISRYFKAPKYERNWFKRNKTTVVGSLIALPLTEAFMIMIGAAAFIVSGTSNPVTALQETASGWMLAMLLLMIVLTQWSTNTAANILPAAAVFSNVFGPRVSNVISVFVVGIIGSVIQPWSVYEVLTQVLLIIGAVLSSVSGILFADYYLLRKRRVNVPDLYKNNGQYQYSKGINVVGFISWGIGGVIATLFMTYSFIIGFVVAAGAYYVLAKYWYFNKYPQAEIINPSDADYLGITVGRDWTIEDNEAEDSNSVHKLV
ncbi:MULTISPECIES: NCS1 family transporter [Oceanobacillus]|uniref:Nitrate reductase n=1 Tax=Oceanobacillus kimchii TaxID=746691 RepID=A0ABQ5TKV2_9BACI|nr:MULTISPECIES: NCS1 family transporter [Oceanobacillus]MBT2600412.1 NCS1 family transporter [Oceanobacillus sp. ISL-74]MBT2650570.1 NCS1 family transporter [Oceanobacillus sp. ISL-73]MCT1578311.1 NCS1 family transporter [Oceanobacillus kimchii]MCT2134489.1 NCS1 family transporter [Oceanobacillus kimchii]OEH54887.1 nitrate reductase [Oceanobacillus sp. E9]